VSVVVVTRTLVDMTRRPEVKRGKTRTSQCITCGHSKGRHSSISDLLDGLLAADVERSFAKVNLIPEHRP
jgi:hypothetical protein